MKLLSIALAGAALTLGACATTPPATLAKSTLTAPTKAVDGSAIAFQADALSCSNAGFRVSPKLADGKYGASQHFEFKDTFFTGAGKGIDRKSFKEGEKYLHVKSMPPGDYVITRPTCSSGQTYYYTPPGSIDIYGEFTVDAGKTNYLGLMQVGKGYGSGGPVFRAIDKSTAGKPLFDADYADKVGAWQVKLAKTVNSSSGRMDELVKLLEALAEKRKAAEAAEAAKETAQ